MQLLMMELNYDFGLSERSFDLFEFRLNKDLPTWLLSNLLIVKTANTNVYSIAPVETNQINMSYQDRSEREKCFKFDNANLLRACAKAMSKQNTLISQRWHRCELIFLCLKI
jgi:hypothetical protein